MSIHNQGTGAATNANAKASQADRVGWYISGDTETDKQKGDWYVTGAMKITKILSDEEADEVVRKYNKKYGTNIPLDYRRRGGRVFNAETMQLEEPGVVSTQGGTAPTDVRYSFAKNGEEFDAIRDKAVTEVGTVMPNLAKMDVTIVEIKRDKNGKLHPFDENAGTAELKKQVRDYAISQGEKILGEVDFEGAKVFVSLSSIGEMVHPKSIKNSIDKEKHLAAILRIKDIIANSIDAEIHPDYIDKDENGKRIVGKYNPNVLVHRIYGAVDIDGEIYLTKTTVKEDKTNSTNKAYTYEVTNIELLEDHNESADRTQRTTNNSITGAKLLQGVEKSHDPGKKLLDESTETTENGEGKYSLDAAVAEAEQMTETNPTDGQKESGNYRKGHVKVDGFDISIEQPKGSVRRGVDADGKEWSQEMHNTYGYIRGTEGVDGDHIDMFLSDHLDDWNGNVYVVDQVNKDGSFDEHKVMYGFNSEQEARDAYLSNYEEGWTGLGNITGVSREEFKKWVDTSHRKNKPFAEYKNVKPLQSTGTEDGVLFSLSLGAPYQGSKGQIATRVVDALPSGRRFVDLFAGGGAVTHAAMLSGKYGEYRVNDINPAGLELFLKGINGDYRDYIPREMSAEEFKQIKGTAEGLMLSYGGLGRNVDPDKDSVARRVRRVQRLEQLKPYADQVESSNSDYRDVELEPGDVVYADIPYEGTNKTGYRKGARFDKQAFSNWGLAQDVPVYVSEQSMPAGWVEVASWEMPSMNAQKKRGEKLFVQERFAGDEGAVMVALTTRHTTTMLRPGSR